MGNDYPPELFERLFSDVPEAGVVFSHCQAKSLKSLSPNGQRLKLLEDSIFSNQGAHV